MAALHARHAAVAKPSIQTALILRTVLAFEMFAVVLSIGGRNFPVLVSEAFVWQHNNQDYGVAAAYAVIVMGVSLAATLVYLCGAAHAGGHSDDAAASCASLPGS